MRICPGHEAEGRAPARPAQRQPGRAPRGARPDHAAHRPEGRATPTAKAPCAVTGVVWGLDRRRTEVVCKAAFSCRLQWEKRVQIRPHSASERPRFAFSGCEVIGSVCGKLGKSKQSSENREQRGGARRHVGPETVRGRTRPARPASLPFAPLDTHLRHAGRRLPACGSRGCTSRRPPRTRAASHGRGKAHAASPCSAGCRHAPGQTPAGRGAAPQRPSPVLGSS